MNNEKQIKWIAVAVVVIVLIFMWFFGGGIIEVTKNVYEQELGE